MKPLDPNLQRLFRQASRKQESAASAPPAGLEDRIISQWRAQPSAGEPIFIFQCACACAVVIALGLSLAVFSWSGQLDPAAAVANAALFNSLSL